MLEENQVTVQKLIEIFESAFMDVSNIEINEGRFAVKGVEFPFFLVVTVDVERKVIRFSDYNPLHRITTDEAAVLCNQANQKLALVRFYAFEHKGTVVAMCNYEMSYEKGLVPFQVVSNFRKFERGAGSAVQAFKEHLRA